MSPNVCSECHIQATAVAGQPELLHMGIMHVQVSCSACHDAANHTVGSINEDGYWATLLSLEIDGHPIDIPVLSHQLQRDVNCWRCHFLENPWGIPESVSWIDLERGFSIGTQEPRITPSPTRDPEYQE